jgi:hypothetical protein
MREALSVFLLCAALAQANGQVSSSKYQPGYQPGTILSVKPHPATNGADSSTIRYDISLRVGNTVYVVLYTPPAGTYGVQYAAGDEMLVLVGSKTITYNDILGNSRKAPILSRKTVSDKSVP